MSYEDIEFKVTVTQAEIYQDLSVSLVHFRETLKRFLVKPSQQLHLEQTIQTRDEHSTEVSFDIVRKKYKKIPQNRLQFENIMHRFILRVKELLRNFVSTAPRYRVSTTLLMKNLEFDLKQANDNKNIKQCICTVLDFIDSFTDKVSQHQSATSHLKIIRQDLYGSLQKRRTPDTSINKPSWQLKTVYKESEAEQFIKNVMKLDCMAIDMEFLRAKYFNLKKNQGPEYNECMLRNQFIRQLITSFQKSYETSKQRLTTSRGSNKAKPAKKSNQRQLSNNELQKNIQQQNSSVKHYQNNFLKPSNQNISHNQRKNKTIQGSKLKSISFRESCQQKMRQFRNVKMKNIVICEEFTPTGIHNINEKKLQFFKRSKEQTKFRYKYYTYIRKDGNHSNLCIRTKNINPELMFTTLTYK